MRVRLLHLARRAGELSAAEWHYLAIAVKELLIARIHHATRPTGSLVRQLQSPPSPPSLGGSHRATRRPLDLTRLGWAIDVAASRVPWRSDCLPRAMAADRWLRRHGHSPIFFLGVTKIGTGELRAHAWLRCNDTTVTGGDSSEFTPLITASPAAAHR